MRLIDHPHHDGSPLYVSTSRPALGESVTLRVRTPAAFGVREVHMRTTPDAEPRFTPLERESAQWWTVTLDVHNPVTNYRFYLLLDGGRPPVWLTAAGLVDGDLPDATDFRLVAYEAPAEWIADAVVYQIFPDRFARRTGAPPLSAMDLPDWAWPRDWDTDAVIGRGDGVSEQFYGGDLDGVIEHLDHIQALGCNTVYLTPVFPARSNHRYDASTFEHVDPLLGGDEALRRLSTALHERGMRLVGDITTNHCGDAHEWFVSAVTCVEYSGAQRGETERPDGAAVHPPERDLFYFGSDGAYESWNGVKSLPKLNWGSDLTRERMRHVLQKWLDDFDGWRIDVANMTGRRGAEDRTHEVARWVRREVTSVRPDAMVVAEHMHDATGDLDRDGWQGTMNYGGFTRPVWTWLRGEHTDAEFFGVPGGVPHRDGVSALATVRAFTSRTSWRTLVHSWNPLDTHDSARMRTVTGSRERHLVAVGLQLTLPGTPMIFAGDEFGLTGWIGEQSRTPMPWNRPHDRDEATLTAYQSMVGLRNTEPELRRGGLRWVHAAADVLAFLREGPDGAVLVLARRCGGEAVDLGLPNGTNLYGGKALEGGRLPAAEVPDFQVWRLNS